MQHLILGATLVSALAVSAAVASAADIEIGPPGPVAVPLSRCISLFEVGAAASLVHCTSPDSAPTTFILDDGTQLLIDAPVGLTRISVTHPTE
jgi:hypothetical protein